MSEMNRREFVIAATVAACACTLTDPAEVLAAPAKPIDVGTVGDYPADGVSDKFIKPHRILVVRADKRIHAMSAVCTHKACAVKLKDNQIKCPCHGSIFSNHGTVTDGPAKVSLVRYGIKQNDAGRIIVDKSKQFREPKWEDPGSFITVA
jgi:Rieske Fe-S protein